jgi:hypothetical protein
LKGKGGIFKHPLVRYSRPFFRPKKAKSMGKKVFKIIRTSILVGANLGICEKMVPTLPVESPTSRLTIREKICTVLKKRLTVRIFSDSTR